ncbi:polysaccharide lyase family 7 protein [Mangrovicoccus algicola]|uniref:Polysaccharide lyase family 7 protein n=1 Tax=Mangrovicoccus algicola TaxID=2771008 RepID=A0A8J6YVE8_9RHOB|nr:polysaccharide lyase family 7 protein [Mangrovicoccus algicola]MBE3636788.1 polysaccharide lyase family 7 protein [Mangrovicoccus algicola]
MQRLTLACGTAALALMGGAALAQTACTDPAQLRVVSAVDDGSFDGSYGPEYAVDGMFDPDSRWSSKGAGKTLTLDLGEAQQLREAGLAFYKGDERRNMFRLEASMDGETFAPVLGETTSQGGTTAIERVDIEDVEARYLRVVGLGNEGSEWNSVLEVQVYGCGSGEMAASGDGSDGARVAGLSAYGLRTDAPPSENFDLTRWKITLPVDRDGNGKVDEIEENDLQGWSDPDFFYTDPVTGGMVFRAVPGGVTTQNSSYVRSELREMMRGGDESISTRIDDGTPNKNNWVFGTAPAEAQELAGGVDGTMRATLAVNQVTRIGERGKVGRVIIGQIHAKDDEPIRLYYRKLPTNKFGSIYFAHEPVEQDDLYVEVIGDRGDMAPNPEDGIALDEVFSYEIRVSTEDDDGTARPMLHVTITRDDGSVIEAEPFDMSDSGYSHGKDFMYFKAGAYSQNNTTTWPERDFDQVTFYKLEVEHE